MKKLSIIILMWVAFLLPSHAVLKEANLDTTLFMLRTELTSYHLDFEKQNEYAKQQQQQIIKELMTIMAQADQNSIMLYSQRNGYIFDLTYAATKLLSSLISSSRRRHRSEDSSIRII